MTIRLLADDAEHVALRDAVEQVGGGGEQVDFDAIPARPQETVLNENLGDLMAELQRVARRGMWCLRVVGVSVLAIVIATGTTVRYGFTALAFGVAGLGVFLVIVGALSAIKMLANILTYRTFTVATYLRRAMLVRLAELLQEGKLTDEEFFAAKRRLGL